jgi:aminoglycoside phosphotransferase (APT) family kinase protein
MLEMHAVTPKYLAELFQLGRPQGMIEVVAHGQCNPYGVRRLRTDLGTFAVKLCDRRPLNAALLIEASAFGAGVPMPEPIRSCTGQLDAFVEDGGRASWIRVHRWVEGEPLSWGTADPETSFGVGRILASLHRLRVPEEALSTEEMPEWAMPTKEKWRRLAEAAVRQQVPWAAELSRKLPFLASHVEYIAGIGGTTERVVPGHRDLHPPNVIKTPDGALVLVDWDSAGPVIAREDVARYALIWAKGEDEPPRETVVRAFIDGYRDAGGLYASKGVADLVGQTETALKWLAFNIRRDLGGRPGPVPELTEALLAGAKPLDLAELERKARLLDY